MSKSIVPKIAGMVAAEESGAKVNPYEILPHSDWVAPTMAYIHSVPESMIKSASVFCYNLQIWHKYEGLTLEETCAIFRAMKKPDRMSQMSYGEVQHYAIFAGLVAQVCRHRRMAQAAAERKLAEQMAIEERRAEPQKFESLLDSLMAKFKRA